MDQFHFTGFYRCSIELKFSKNRIYCTILMRMSFICTLIQKKMMKILRSLIVKIYEWVDTLGGMKAYDIWMMIIIVHCALWIVFIWWKCWSFPQSKHKHRNNNNKKKENKFHNMKQKIVEQFRSFGFRSLNITQWTMNTEQLFCIKLLLHIIILLNKNKMNILIVFFWSEHPFDDLSDWFWYWCGGIRAMCTIIRNVTFFQANVSDFHALTFPIYHIRCVACVIRSAPLLCRTGITFWNYYNWVNHNQFKLLRLSPPSKYGNLKIWLSNDPAKIHPKCQIAMVRMRWKHASVNGTPC